MSLVELAAQEVARNIPFEIVEHAYPPVPEEVQLRIAFWSFPESEDDIRLYSCLANGSAEEFTRGENLLKGKAVKELLQIGFHLSATVTPPNAAAGPSPATKATYNVAITFDRRRVTSCDCTCSSPSSWCSHVVSVCLFRIHQPAHVTLRAPVSESLSRLERDQLQKFAQYLISELPQQILPTAQRLLDELLSSHKNSMNTTCGAPDPTAGASAHEQTSWCLDESQLHENIHKILVKFCMPSPMVYSDVNYLSSNAPPAAAEWQSLLRPLRGREPEGMWNLLSIVREMFRRGDQNAIPLLVILTEEVLACDQITLWWFNTRVSLHSGGHGNRAGFHSSSTHASQNACSSLCDEIVVLWRLACLNPRLSLHEKATFLTQLKEWHMDTVDRVAKQKSGGKSGPNCGAAHAAPGVKKMDFEIFTGFKPALEACLLQWDDYPIAGVTDRFSSPKRWFCPFNHSHTHTKEGCSGLEQAPLESKDTCAKETSNDQIKCLLRGRGRSVEVGPCSEWRVTPTGSFLAPGTYVPGVGLSVINCKKDSPAEQLPHTPSSSSSSLLTNCSTIATSPVNSESTIISSAECVPPPPTPSNRSSVSSEGFGEETDRTPAGAEAGQEEKCPNSASSSDSQLPSNGPPVNLDVTRKIDPVSVSTNSKGKPADPLELQVKKIEDPLEILFARAEALHAHGFTREACRLAVQLAEEMLNNPPNLMVDLPAPPARGKRNKRFNPASHQISLLASTTLSKAAFLCSVLAENADNQHLAFRIGLFGLELARPPASTKALEVKLANQEQDLVVLLKRIPLTFMQLQVLRQKAEQLRDNCYKGRGPALLPLMLSQYIFDALVLSATSAGKSGISITGRQTGDELLGFEAAVATLALKANVAEAEHPLLCEGTRRQRGDLAMSLLVHYKDDAAKLFRIMDKLLDKDVHQMRKNYSVADSATPAVPASHTSSPPSASATPATPSSPTSTTASVTSVKTVIDVTKNAEGLSSSNSDESLESKDVAAVAAGGLSCTYPRIAQSADTSVRSAERRPSDCDRSDGASSPCWDEDYKQWEARFRCTNLKTAKKHSVGMASVDSSAPETTSSDNSPTVVRRTLWLRGPGVTGPPSDSGSSGESSDSFNSGSSDKIPKTGAQPSTTPPIAAASTGPAPPVARNGVESATAKVAQMTVSNASSSPPATQPKAVVTIATAAGNLVTSVSAGSQNQANVVLGKVSRYKGKKACPTIPNQPSEASAHFMFELAKTILNKAGGNSSSAVHFMQQPSNNAHRGPHRALHMCAFQIGVYALGLHNAVTNWLSRTYSSHVSWITGQAMEIGSAAIEFLIETWDGHLTPTEVCGLADRASRNRDSGMVKAAAQLALSCLPHAHALNHNEIQRALIQCKEQSNDFLEQACLAVESAAKGGGVSPEVLFDVAHKWYELYKESLSGRTQPGSRAAGRNGTGRVQASIGEFQVPAVNSLSHPNNVVGEHERQVLEGPPFMQQNVPAAVSQVAPMNLVPAGAYSLPPPPTSYSYGFFAGMPHTFPQQQMAVHPAFIQPPALSYPYYPGVTATATALVTAATGMPGMRGPFPLPNPMFAGQPLLPGTMAVTQAVTQRFQMMSQPQQHQMMAMHTGHFHPHHVPHPGFPIPGHLHQPPVQPLQQLNQRQSMLLLSAYRVGMLAMETLGRRVHDDRPQIKYARNPPNGEHVIWLLNIAKKLGMAVACETFPLFIPILFQARHTCRSFACAPSIRSPPHSSCMTW